MFLTYDRVFPAAPTEADLLRIVRPRPGLPFTRVALGGRPRLAWTTFTPHQIDLDVHDPAARAYLSAVLRRLAGCGVAMVRLDAVGYAVKTAGHVVLPHPGDLRLRRRPHRRGPRARAAGARRGARPAPLRREQAAAHVDRVYDFALAPAGAARRHTGDAAPLRRWLARRPPTPSPCSTPTTASGWSTPARPPGPRACSRPRRSRRSSTRIAATARARACDQPGPGRGLPGQLHALRRAGPRRPALPAGPPAAAVHARASRRSTTSACWPAATSPCDRQRRAGRSTGAGTPTAEVDAALQQPVVEPCGNCSGCATATRPSTASSRCRTRRRGAGPGLAHRRRRRRAAGRAPCFLVAGDLLGRRHDTDRGGHRPRPETRSAAARSFGGGADGQPLRERAAAELGDLWLAIARTRRRRRCAGPRTRTVTSSGPWSRARPSTFS